MSSWTIIFSKRAQKDAKKLAQSHLKLQAQNILDQLKEDPFYTPPSYKRLVGNLAGYYSRRINVKHRIVYEVHDSDHVVHVLSMWTHYE